VYVAVACARAIGVCGATTGGANRRLATIASTSLMRASAGLAWITSMRSLKYGDRTNQLRVSVGHGGCWAMFRWTVFVNPGRPAMVASPSCTIRPALGVVFAYARGSSPSKLGNSCTTTRTSPGGGRLPLKSRSGS
jgi:hypothetical protein